MNIIRGALIIFGAVMLVWFAIPIFFLSIFNAGNAVGILASAIVLFYGIWFKSINGAILHCWQNGGKLWLTVLAVVLAVVVLFAGVATVKIISAANNAPTKVTTVVVLGCQVHPWGPSMMLEERLVAAHKFLTENEDVKCILSGGQGEDEVISEAQCMYNWLTERGIEKNRLYIEDKSTSTRENLAFSKEIIEKEGLNPAVTVVTNGFHQYRAKKIAESLGIESYCVSGRTFKTMLPTYYVREIGGILYEMLIPQ